MGRNITGSIVGIEGLTSIGTACAPRGRIYATRAGGAPVAFQTLSWDVPWRAFDGNAYVVEIRGDDSALLRSAEAIFEGLCKLMNVLQAQPSVPGISGWGSSRLAFAVQSGLPTKVPLPSESYLWKASSILYSSCTEPRTAGRQSTTTFSVNLHCTARTV